MVVLSYGESRRRQGEGKVGRNLIIGDIHGMYDRMLSALSNAGFDPVQDTLYSVGDLCDRGEGNLEVVQYLMDLPHFLPVVGNHDLWLYQFLSDKGASSTWLMPINGGQKTYEAFSVLGYGMRWKIRKWLGSFAIARFNEKYIILHAGIPEMIGNEAQLESLLEGVTLKDVFSDGKLPDKLIEGVVWDRDYIKSALFPGQYGRKPFRTERTILCGHTPLVKVLNSSEYHIICIDTGSFVPFGHITVMDMDSGEFFSS